MTELQQRRWFTRKSINLQSDREIVVTQRRLFGTSAGTYGLFDLHPFYERYTDNAYGYLLSAGLLLLLAISTGFLAWEIQQTSLWLLCAVFGACTAVLLILFASHRISKYEFFHRGTGKVAFCLWRSGHRMPEIESFAKKITTLTQLAIENRFQDASQVLNPRLRHGASEEAIYCLYRLGVLDFAEMETLLVNSERKYHGCKVDQHASIKPRKNNVIDFQKYRQELLSENNA